MCVRARACTLCLQDEVVCRGLVTLRQPKLRAALALKAPPHHRRRAEDGPVRSAPVRQLKQRKANRLQAGLHEQAAAHVSRVRSATYPGRSVPLSSKARLSEKCGAPRSAESVHSTSFDQQGVPQHATLCQQCTNGAEACIPKRTQSSAARQTMLSLPRSCRAACNVRWRGPVTIHKEWRKPGGRDVQRSFQARQG